MRNTIYTSCELMLRRFLQLRAATACWVGLVVFYSSLSSAESSGWRELNEMGCHNVNGICYIKISGDSVGPDSCRRTSIRWDKNLDPNGDAIYSSLLAAFHSSFEVNITLVDDACFVSNPDYPTISYINVRK